MFILLISLSAAIAVAAHKQNVATARKEINVRTAKFLKWETDIIILYTLSLFAQSNNARARRNSPLEPLFRRARAQKPCHTARILGGQNPERKTPFPFSEKIHPRQNQNARSVFFRGCRAERGGGGAIRRAYDLGQSHHALRACFIRGSAGNESELFGIMSTLSTPPPRRARSVQATIILGERRLQTR